MPLRSISSRDQALLSTTMAIRGGSNSTGIDRTAQVTYVIRNPAATGVTLQASLASPQPPGTEVTFTAAGQGSVGPFQYRFWLSTNGGAYALVQDWSTAASWPLPATTVPGTYTVKVDTRTGDYLGSAN